MNRRQLKEAADRILAANPEPSAPQPLDGAAVEWSLSPVAAETEWDDEDAEEIASTFAVLSGGRVFVEYAGVLTAEAILSAEYMAELRARNDLLARRWREAEKAARRDPIRGPVLRRKDAVRKRRERFEVKAVGDLFERVHGGV